MKHLLAVSVPAVLALVVIVSVACQGPGPTPPPPPAPELTMPLATQALPPMPSPTPTVAPTPSQAPSAERAPTPEPAREATPGPTSTRVPPPTPEPTPAGERIDWSSCESDPELKCGFVEVPADYRDPEAGSLSIAVNVHRATSPDQRVGYLLVNPGGPGWSGLEMAAGAAIGGFSAEIVERFDIVGFDPRGARASEPAFACGDPGDQIALLSTIDEYSDTPEEMEAGEAAANLCIQSMGPVGEGCTPNMLPGTWTKNARPWARSKSLTTGPAMARRWAPGMHRSSPSRSELWLSTPPATQWTQPLPKMNASWSKSRQFQRWLRVSKQR